MRTYTEIFKDMEPFTRELAERCKIKVVLTVSEKEFDKFAEELKNSPVLDSPEELLQRVKSHGIIELIHDKTLDV